MRITRTIMKRRVIKNWDDGKKNEKDDNEKSDKAIMN